MSTILFYAPFNYRSRDTESLMVAFKRQGHRVLLLSQVEGLIIGEFLKLHGIETRSFIARSPITLVRHLQNLFFFSWFCRVNKVDVVYSHLEAANFIASMAQFFVRAKIFICRHHTDQYKLLGIDEDISYRITYRLARRIIVFSRESKRHMIENEGIDENKITKINLAYDFSFYPKPNQTHIQEIKGNMSSELLLITAGALNSLKRPAESVNVLKLLIDSGVDAKLILLGKGNLEEDVRNLVLAMGLTQRVNFAGYVDNILEYMSAATILLHPSISESSCVVIKEAGLVELPVIVCRGIGDFDDYLIHKKNGFLVDRNNFAEEASELILQNFRNRQFLESIGKNLKESVVDIFGIDKVIQSYDSYNKSQ